MTQPTNVNQICKNLHHPRQAGRFAARSLGAWTAVAGLALGLVISSPAQVLQQWSHQAAIGEASAAVAMGGNYMFVADNEDEVLRLYDRVPTNACAAPAYAFDARPYLTPATSSPEADLEAAVKVTDASGTRIYWLGSHSNSKTGKSRPDRFRFFATQVSGTGAGATPYSLSFVGRYDGLRTDLIAWDQNNLHGKGANYFGLAASAYAASSGGVAPTRIDGFNIEGLVMAPDGVTAYIAFRAPLVNGSGPTTSLDQRTNALLIPLLNMPALVTGSPTAGPGVARFGTPITLPLGARGVRSIDSSYPGHYLITAGPTADVTYPPVAPNNFCLFTWTGNPADAPVERMTEFPYGMDPEGAIVSPGPITSNTVVQFVCDDSGGCWRSFIACAGPVMTPVLNIAPSGGNIIVSWPASAAGYQLEHCADLVQKNWVDCTTAPASYGVGKLAVVEPADGIRFYRLIKTL